MGGRLGEFSFLPFFLLKNEQVHSCVYFLNTCRICTTSTLVQVLQNMEDTYFTARDDSTVDADPASAFIPPNLSRTRSGSA